MPAAQKSEAPSGLIWSIAVNKHRTDTQPKERPKPKTYRKPGALSDLGDEPTEPTPTDIVGSVGSGGAGNDDTQNRQTPTHDAFGAGSAPTSAPRSKLGQQVKRGRKMVTPANAQVLAA